MVGIFVGLNVQYLSHNDLGYLAALRFVAFYLGAAHCDALAEILYAHVSDINIIGEPFH